MKKNERPKSPLEKLCGMGSDIDPFAKGGYGSILPGIDPKSIDAYVEKQQQAALKQVRDEQEAMRRYVEQDRQRAINGLPSDLLSSANMLQAGLYTSAQREIIAHQQLHRVVSSSGKPAPAIVAEQSKKSTWKKWLLTAAAVMVPFAASPPDVEKDPTPPKAKTELVIK